LSIIWEIIVCLLFVFGIFKIFRGLMAAILMNSIQSVKSYEKLDAIIVYLASFLIVCSFIFDAWWGEFSKENIFEKIIVTTMGLILFMDYQSLGKIVRNREIIKIMKNQ
jgi:hypothetical protein